MMVDYSTHKKYSLPSKYQEPGWRIEQRYSQGVLIGNWSEDRHEFQKGEGTSTSAYRESYRPYDPKKFAPDPTTRLKGVLRNAGLGKDQVFTHHGTRYMHNNISLYDQTFNRQYSLGMRKWDGKRMAWLPEASDHPLQGEATKFGLKEAIEEKWRKLKELEEHGDFTSSTKLSYKEPPNNAYTSVRAAVGKDISCRSHPNRINRDLNLRGMYYTLFKETVDPKFGSTNFVKDV